MIPDYSDVLARLYEEHSPDALSRPSMAPTSKLGTELAVTKTVERARTASNGAKFIELFDRGDFTGYGSHNDADAALLLRLAFWFNGNADLMEIAFGVSALGQRDKWSCRADYRERSIRAVLREWNGKGWTGFRQPPSNDVLRILDRLDRWACFDQMWSGRSGPRNRYVMDALLYVGNMQGAIHRTTRNRGVEVSTSYRHLALAAGYSKLDSVKGAIEHLREMDVVDVLSRGRDETTSNTYLLMPVDRSGYYTAGEQVEVPVYKTVHPLRTLIRQVRENGRDFEGGDIRVRGRDGKRNVVTIEYREPRRAQVVGSVGKRGALLIEKVLLNGGTMDEVDAMKSLGSRNVRELMSRVGSRVFNAGLLKRDGNELTIPDDLENVLKNHIESTGCEQARRNQEERYRRDREILRGPSTSQKQTER